MFGYKRRETIAVKVGDVIIGGGNPIRLQSMTSTSTMDTEGSVAQIKSIVDAGGELVRLTAQGVREAENLANIHAQALQQGVKAPLVADIHFNPAAAEVAARHVEKVRINPGNFVDPGRTFRQLEYTDEEYAGEILRIERRLLPLIEICREHGTAMRIGVNHGSLSDRIMSRYGDTPAGVVESAMEFLRLLVKHEFFDVVVSIKCSNTVLMVATVRRLVAAMEQEQMKFPLHLGVTEAGNGEDGRIKSAIGIGTLLADGIGDTIRVSLSEEPAREIPVAAMLTERLSEWETLPPINGGAYPGYEPLQPKRHVASAVGNIGGVNSPVAIGVDGLDKEVELVEIDIDRTPAEVVNEVKGLSGKVALLTTKHCNPAAALRATLHALAAADVDVPAIPVIDYGNTSAEKVPVYAGADFGSILLDGFHDGIALRSSTLSQDEVEAISLGVLQGARLRQTRAEFISCPGCGRTLFDLRTTVDAVKERLSHLTHLKIGVMGCIVNGPGEMADADYGYVGAAAGHVSLYRRKECVERNIPQADALPRLIALIKADGQWIESRLQ